MLSLENTGDIVPMLDGQPNPDAHNRTTVRFDATDGNVGENHGMDRYALGGALVDDSDHPTLATYRDSLHQGGWFDQSATVETRRVTITRAVP